MRLHLGPDIENPTIAATLSAEEFAESEQNSSFTDTLEKLNGHGNISLSQEDDSHTMLFLLKRIGRRPAVTIPDYLLPVAEMISWLSSFPDEANATMTELYIDPYPIPVDGRRGLGMTLEWPRTAPEKVTSFANGVMHSIGRQIRYNNSFGRKRAHYEGDVCVILDRPKGVTISAGLETSASIETVPEGWRAYKPEASKFHLSSHNVYSQQQLLVCLAGGIAVARADELLATA